MYVTAKDPFIDVASLGFICLLVMTVRSKGHTPVTLKAASMVSFVNARRYVRPNSEVKSALETLALCRVSNSFMTCFQASFILAKHTTSSLWRA